MINRLMNKLTGTTPDYLECTTTTTSCTCVSNSVCRTYGDYGDSHCTSYDSRTRAVCSTEVYGCAC